jgi:hypothetical protein
VAATLLPTRVAATHPLPPNSTGQISRETVIFRSHQLIITTPKREMYSMSACVLGQMRKMGEVVCNNSRPWYGFFKPDKKHEKKTAK